MFTAVERWSSAALAAVPAIDTENGKNTLPDFLTITTAKAGSVVTWALGSWAFNTPTAFVTSTATPVIEYNNDALVHAYQAAQSAGVQDYGATEPSTPTEWRWTSAALEIQAAAPKASGNFFALI